MFDDSIDYPGCWALFPACGAAAMIYAEPTSSHQFILGSPIMVFLGQISYPLYLWHWPLLVFAKLCYPVAALRPWYGEAYAMVLLALTLSLATFYLVENNLRRGTNGFVDLGLLASIVLLATMGVLTYCFSDSFSAISHRITAAANVGAL
ncbi:Aste57867_7140 [Aphanomyces stellatus]|nr:hypothetical protein As57867_007116 [Aphanomyces stellatus]VFT84072.1 Aste57867_7140 [Aphanomyces stellatus]